MELKVRLIYFNIAVGMWITRNFPIPLLMAINEKTLLPGQVRSITIYTTLSY